MSLSITQHLFAGPANEMTFVALMIQVILSLPMIIFERYHANKLSVDAIELAKTDKENAWITKFKAVHTYSTYVFFVYLFFYSIYHALAIVHSGPGEVSPADLALFFVIGAIITFMNGFSLLFISYINFKKGIYKKFFEGTNNNGKKIFINIVKLTYDAFIGIILLLLSAAWTVHTLGPGFGVIPITSAGIINHDFLIIIAIFSFAAGLLGLFWVIPAIIEQVAIYKKGEMSQWEIIMNIGHFIVLWIVVTNFGIIATGFALIG